MPVGCDAVSYEAVCAVRARYLVPGSEASRLFELYDDVELRAVWEAKHGAGKKKIRIVEKQDEDPLNTVPARYTAVACSVLYALLCPAIFCTALFCSAVPCAMLYSSLHCSVLHSILGGLVRARTTIDSLLI